jgi:ArsR family transcriptional regulator
VEFAPDSAVRETGATGGGRLGIDKGDIALTTIATRAGKPKSAKAAPRSARGPKVSDQTIKGLAEVFKLLADQSRLKILLALAEDGEMHVSALCNMLNQSQPAVSHHLTLLRMAGLVGFRRDGKHNFYSVEASQVRDLLDQFFDEGGTGSRQIQFGDVALAIKRGK